jgi:hypothetical protein
MAWVALLLVFCGCSGGNGGSGEGEGAPSVFDVERHVIVAVNQEEIMSAPPRRRIHLKSRVANLWERPILVGGHQSYYARGGLALHEGESAPEWILMPGAYHNVLTPGFEEGPTRVAPGEFVEIPTIAVIPAGVPAVQLHLRFSAGPEEDSMVSIERKMLLLISTKAISAVRRVK